MKETNLLMCVQEAISEPQLARNIRGQLRAALDCLPYEVQVDLACSFVEHAFDILLDSRAEAYRSAFTDSLQAIRGALAGAVTPEEVHKNHCEAIEQSTFETSLDGTGTMIDIGGDGNLLILLEDCCLREQLEAAGLLWQRWRRRKQTTAFEIAAAIGYEVARHAGGKDWDSEDSSSRARARKRGQEASDEEMRWQRSEIVDSLQAAVRQEGKAKVAEQIT